MLTATIFGKIYLHADPDGVVTVADTTPAEPFADIPNAAHTLTQHQI